MKEKRVSFSLEQWYFCVLDQIYCNYKIEFIKFRIKTQTQVVYTNLVPKLGRNTIDDGIKKKKTFFEKREKINKTWLYVVCLFIY